MQPLGAWVARGALCCLAPPVPATTHACLLHPIPAGCRPPTHQQIMIMFLIGAATGLSSGAGATAAMVGWCCPHTSGACEPLPATLTITLPHATHPRQWPPFSWRWSRWWMIATACDPSACSRAPAPPRARSPGWPHRHAWAGRRRARAQRTWVRACAWPCAAARRLAVCGARVAAQLSAAPAAARQLRLAIAPWPKVTVRLPPAAPATLAACPACPAACERCWWQARWVAALPTCPHRRRCASRCWAAPPAAATRARLTARLGAKGVSIVHCTDAIAASVCSAPLWHLVKVEVATHGALADEAWLAQPPKPLPPPPPPFFLPPAFLLRLPAASASSAAVRPSSAGARRRGAAAPAAAEPLLLSWPRGRAPARAACTGSKGAEARPRATHCWVTHLVSAASSAV